MTPPARRAVAAALALAFAAPSAVAAQPAPAPSPTRAPPPPPPASPPALAPGAGPAALLGAANAALDAGDPGGAAVLAERALAADPTSADRTEAARVLGLARYFLGRRPMAEAAFVEYLLRDPEAHLDPTLVPPEAIVFFEDVRARHATELAVRRPPRGRVPSPWLAAIPIASQAQNGEVARAWAYGGVAAALLAVNLSSYVWLRRRCDASDGTCYRGPGDPSHPDHHDLAGPAATARSLNLASGVGLIGLGVYLAIDGVRGYRRRTRELSIGPTIGAGAVGLSLATDL